MLGTVRLLGNKMANSVLCRLIEYLHGITKKELKVFKLHLRDYPLEEGDMPIRYGKMEKADRADMARLMVNAYEDTKALQMTVRILDGINRKDVSEEIRKAMPECKYKGPTTYRHSPYVIIFPFQHILKMHSLVCQEGALMMAEWRGSP